MSNYIWDDTLKNKVVVDTNLLLDDSKILFKLTKQYSKIIIPITVTKELDAHKTNPNTGFSARQAIRAIKEFKMQFPDKIEFDLTGCNEEKELTNDTRIIKCAQNTQSTLATKDISMGIIAEAQGVKVRMYDAVLNNLFNPYLYIEQKLLFECSDAAFDYAKVFQDSAYDEVLNLFKITSNRLDVKEDTWFFVIISNTSNNKVVYANNPIKRVLQRIDNDPNYCVIKDYKKEIKTIKARDIYQKCAIYALKESQHVLITGRWGSGKTLLATAQALSQEDKKLFVSRAPIGLNSKYNIGFTPGSIADKMSEWLAGFMSALYYLYSNTRGQDRPSEGYDYVREVLFNNKLEPMPLNSIQGLSLLDNDTLIVDEAQLIDVNYMSMILSRPSESGRLILLGDLGQTYEVVKPSESGLLKLLRILPHKSIAYVDLKTSYRSEILELADLLQDKTIG